MGGKGRAEEGRRKASICGKGRAWKGCMNFPSLPQGTKVLHPACVASSHQERESPPGRGCRRSLYVGSWCSAPEVPLTATRTPQDSGQPSARRAAGNAPLRIGPTPTKPSSGQVLAVDCKVHPWRCPAAASPGPA
eukprot:scaffold7924_cov267-Pinguiococcus_pyrenoidosus.AAC.3